jgi:hypothetical protein
MTFWLFFFTVVAWLAILAMNYAMFICLIPRLAITIAGLGLALSKFMILNISWANFLVTYGLPICVVLLILIPRLAKSFGRLPRLGRATTVVSSLTLVFMAAIVAVDGRYLVMQWPAVEKWGEEISYESSALKGLNATRSVIVAEYRYRELHPKVGFTCDLDSLELLGGPAKGDQPIPWTNRPNTRIIDIYTLSLGACQDQPVAKYKVSATPDPAYKEAAYCSDGSGAMYSAADGRSETCLTARTPLR